MASITADRPEPLGVTVADLVALVLGVALAMALPWPPGRPWNGPRAALQFTAQAAARSALALLPVVLARRVRYGGLARPAEFLAAACGLAQLPVAIGHLIFTLRTGFDPWSNWDGPALDGDEVLRREELWNAWQEQIHQQWPVAMLPVTCLAALALALGGRRWPGWLGTVLLLLTWLGLSRAALAILPGYFSPEMPGNGTATGRLLDALVYSVAFLVPFKLFFDVPAGAAWHRLRSVRAPRPSWLEWVALGSAFGLFLANFSGFFYQSYPPGFWAWKWSFLPTTAVSVALGLMIARRYLPAWSGLDAARGGGMIPVSGNHPWRE
jgi:hypothetical protein